MAVTVRLLGPVSVVRDGQTIDVGGRKQRTVLGVLALSAGRRVSTERLVDLVWSEDPPASARRTMQSYLASLRGTLGSDAPLTSLQGGYALEISPDDVDLLWFESAVVAALRDVEIDPAAAAAALAGALGHWEVPFDGLRAGSRLGELAAPFEELQLQAVEGLAAAQIAGGQASDAVRMLEALVREHPTREHLWLHLARGLTVCGRRDAALTAIHRAREALREHLGVDPSERIIAVETHLLAGTLGEGTTALPPAPSIHAMPTLGASASTAAAVGNLPERVAPLLCRERELSALAGRLADSRLVTVHGPAGVGKTQTALELCRRVRGEYPGGCWFVDLSRAESADDLDDGLRVTIGSVAGRIAEPSPNRTLALIDNCEHLVDAVGRAVRELLARVPEITVVCTSRQPLSIPGETVIRLDPLSTSVASGGSVSDATALMIELARQATGSDVGRADRAVLDRCATRLGGLPLSIHLAAACLRSMTPEELSEELDHQIEVLRRGTGDEHDRHMSLSAAIDWSYGLLEPTDHRVFDQLAVFAGAFERGDVEQVVDAGDVEAVPAVRRLVEQSLVQATSAHGRTIFTLLDAVKEFARARLVASGADEGTRDRHAAHVLEAVETVLEERGGHHGHEATDRLQLLLPDLRSAARWLEQRGRLDEARRALQMLGTAAARCGRSHLETGASRRALSVVNEVLREQPDDLDLREVAANAAWRIDELDEAAEHARALVVASQRRNQPDRQAVGTSLLADIRREQHRYVEVDAALHDLEELVDQLAPVDRAAALIQIAHLSWLTLREHAAFDAVDRALAIADELGDRSIREQALVERGSTLLTIARFDEGMRILYDTLPYHQANRDHVRVARITWNLASYEIDPAARRRIIEQCREASTLAGMSTINTEELDLRLSIDEGDLDGSRRLAASHLRSAAQFQLADAQLAAAHLALEAGDLSAAHRIIDSFDDHPRELVGHFLLDRLLAGLRLSALGDRATRLDAEIARLTPLPSAFAGWWMAHTLDDLHQSGVDHRLLAPVYRDLVANRSVEDLPETLYVCGWVEEHDDVRLARRSYERALDRTTGERHGDRIDPAFGAAVRLGLARLDEGAGRLDDAIAHLERAVQLLENWPGPRRQRAIAERVRLSGSP